MEWPKVIEVGIGLAFLFMLLSSTASLLVEMISTMLNARGRMLHFGIKQMLHNSRLATVEQVYAHVLIKALGRQADSAKDNARPSYISASAFSAVVLQPLLGDATSPEEALAKIKGNVKGAGVEKDPLASLLQMTLASQGGNVQGVRLAIEKWYNEAMDRVSGWYKRRIQFGLLSVGLLVAFLGNIDALRVGAWLWQGDAARAAITAAAAASVAKGGLVATPAVAGAPPSVATDTVIAQGQKVIAIDRELLALNYPIGWNVGGDVHINWLSYIAGALITALAISTGSSFWFDALQNFLKLRGTGPKPTK